MLPEAPVKISLKTKNIYNLKTKHLDVQGPGGSGSSGVAGPGKNGEKRERCLLSDNSIP